MDIPNILLSLVSLVYFGNCNHLRLTFYCLVSLVYGGNCNHLRFQNLFNLTNVKRYFIPCILVEISLNFYV